MEEKKKKGTGKTVVIVLLLLIILCLVGYILYDKGIILKQKEEPKTEKKEEKLALTDSTKKKLKRFVEAGSYFDGTGYSSTLEDFKDGTTSISDDTKLKMTYVTLTEENRITKGVALTDKDLTGIEGVKPDQNETVETVLITDFDNTYNELFNEDAEYTLKDLELIGCPSPMAINKTVGKIYLFNRCGGTTTVSYNREISSYVSDAKNYYVHQDILLEQDSSVSYKLIWKFDKDLNFVSTEKEED